MSSPKSNSPHFQPIWYSQEFRHPQTRRSEQSAFAVGGFVAAWTTSDGAGIPTSQGVAPNRSGSAAGPKWGKAQSAATHSALETYTCEGGAAIVTRCRVRGRKRGRD
jgi:hypothetical protein